MLLEGSTSRAPAYIDPDVGIADFVPAVSPHLDSPTHFDPYIETLERAFRGERVRAVVAAPPQHGKTTVAEHGFSWGLTRDPSLKHAYVTYEAGRAGDVGMRISQIARDAGVDAFGNRRILRTQDGGQVLFTGIGGPLTGYGITGLALVDDPIKNREEANSKVIRERINQWFRDVLLTRIHKHASVIVMATRWHPDDLSGTLIKEGWHYINLPAIAEDDDPLGREDGEALCPDRFPAEYLEQVRREVGEYTWAALYQGRPRPRGGAVFEEPARYSELPRRGYRVAFGVDLAYTAKTSADYSVLIELWEHDGNYYLTDVIRRQVSAPDFTLALRARSLDHPRVRMRWDASGTEKGAADFIKKHGVPLDVYQAKGDPFMRAQAVAAASNDGKLLVPNLEHFPEAERWLTPLLDELLSFTGVNDAHDDQVVALASAFASLQRPKNAYRKARKKRGNLPKPRM